MQLTNKNIADSLKKIEIFFDSANVSARDKIKICMLLEENLLRYQDKFGENHDFKLITRKWLGSRKVLLKVRGTPYNPLENGEEEQIFSQSIINNLSNYEQADVTYRYERGYNEITAFSSKEAKGMKILGGSSTIAILLAFLLAFVMKKFCPAAVQAIIMEDIISPVLDVLLGAIITVNIPMIFISIVASICSIENVTMLNNLGTRILRRFFAVMVLIAFISIIISGIVFPVINFSLDGTFWDNNYIEFKHLFSLFLSIIPQNVFAAFIEHNVLQIVVIAWTIGACITILGDKVNGIKKIVIESRELIYKMVSVIFKLIPTIMFLCVLKTALTISFESFNAVWEMLIAVYSSYAIVCSIMLLRIKVKYKIKIWDCLQKIYPAFLISFITCSGSASMPKNIEVCEKELKIDKNLCELYIPLANALFPTTMIIAMVVYPIFAAQFSGINIPLVQLCQ